MSRKKRSSRKRQFLEGSAAAIGVYLFFIVVNVMRPGNSECITASWCISAEDQLFQFALYQTLALLVMLGGVVLGLMLSIWLFFKNCLFLASGSLIITVAGLGIVSVLLSTPPESLRDFYHVIVICGGLFVLGVFLMSIDWRRRGGNK